MQYNQNKVALFQDITDDSLEEVLYNLIVNVENSKRPEQEKIELYGRETSKFLEDFIGRARLALAAHLRNPIKKIKTPTAFILNKIRGILLCHPNRFCRNMQLCPFCLNAFRNRLYTRYAELDPTLDVYVHRLIYELPRGTIYVGSAMVMPEEGDLEDYKSTILFDEMASKIDKYGLRRLSSALDNPSQFFDTIHRVDMGPVLYSEPVDGMLPFSTLSPLLEQRRASITKRIKKSTEIQYSDSIMDQLNCARTFMQKRVNSNASVSRLIIHPVLTETPSPVPLTRVELDTVFLLRPCEAKRIKEYELFQSDSHYSVIPFGTTEDPSICYRVKKIFTKKRIHTNRDFYQLLYALFAPVRSYCGFLSEEILAYTYAFSRRQSVTVTGEFTDREF